MTRTSTSCVGLLGRAAWDPSLEYSRHEKCQIFQKYLQNKNSKACMGVLISSNYVLTEINCNVEAVWSTVSLGSNIDDNNIEGEFSVESYEVMENNFGKILGIEL